MMELVDGSQTLFHLLLVSDPDELLPHLLVDSFLMFSSLSKPIRSQAEGKSLAYSELLRAIAWVEAGF